MMRYLWRSSAVIALVIILAMAGLALFLAGQLHDTYMEQVKRDLVLQVQAVARQEEIARAVRQQDRALLQPMLQQAAVYLRGFATGVSVDGRVIADSRADVEPGTDLSRMPEVRAALSSTGWGISARADDVTGEPVYFVAVPVVSGGATVGVMRLAFLQAPILAALREMQLMVGAACAAAALVMVLLAVFLTENSVRGLRRLTHFAERISEGDLDARVLSLTRGELAELARAFNRMADKLQSQIKKRAREKDRLNTVMRVMTDGVIILNKRGQVRLLNPAAAQLLNTTPKRALGKSFVQVARDHRIAEIWERCRTSETVEVAAVEIGSSLFVRVVVTPFLKRTARGYLVILQDLTQMRRLQTIRQDFVSNVSHELRTPLASIRALVETLRDGAMDDPPAAYRFLDRMEVEVDALTYMVEELLELSRIESGQVPLRFAQLAPDAVLGIGAERLRPQAERAQVELRVEIPENLPEILVDSGRIQQVVTNLVHNAIKFTPPGGSIIMSAWEDNEIRRVVVVVRDTGEGIPAGELDRIFERFYKTDRSRAAGGTGLGLAISKHIVQAHGGEIWAESAGDNGSSFYFALPLAADYAGAEMHEIANGFGSILDDDNGHDNDEHDRDDHDGEGNDSDDHGRRPVMNGAPLNLL